MTFHPKMALESPAGLEQALVKQHANSESSHHVVTLLQQLQQELLDSIPPEKRYHGVDLAEATPAIE